MTNVRFANSRRAVIFCKTKKDRSQFSSIFVGETISLQIVNLLHKVDENTYTKQQKELEFQMPEPKQNFNLDEPSINPEQIVFGGNDFPTL